MFFSTSVFESYSLLWLCKNSSKRLSGFGLNCHDKPLGYLFNWQISLLSLPYSRLSEPFFEMPDSIHNLLLPKPNHMM